MRFSCLTLLWGIAAFLLTGCAVYGAREPYCTPEESLRSPSLLFRDKHLLGNDEENTQDYQNVFYSLWDAENHAYCYFLQEISQQPKNGRPNVKETRINSNSVAKIRYFRYQDNCYADIRFDNDENRLHHLCLVGVLGDRVVFTSFGPWLAKDEQWESCEQYEVVKDKKGKPQRIVFKGTPAQLKKMIGTVLHPVFVFTGQLPHNPLPEKADGIFSRKYREKFLLHFIRLQQNWLQNRGKTSRSDFDQAVGFLEEILNEDGSKKLSPKVIAEAKKLVAEQKRMIAEFYKGK